MRHFKYTAPINTWGKFQRQTIQSAFQHWLIPHRMPIKCNGTADMKYERALSKYNARRNRDAVGLVRAFGSPTWFKGCYVGAEND
jgi:hypothetical protein